MLNELYHSLDPIAFAVGPLVVRWYGLAYLAGFVMVGVMMMRTARRWKLEITLDDVPYIYDPTLQYEQWYGPGTHTYENFFQKTYESVSGWGYTRG